MGELLRAIDGYKGNFKTCCALRLAPLVFLRPINLRKLLWEHVSLVTAEIRLPGRLLKMREDLIIPLARQAVEILQELHPLTHATGFVFPGEGKKVRSMSENTVNGALRSLGYSTEEEMTGHGFRAMARTIWIRCWDFVSSGSTCSSRTRSKIQTAGPTIAHHFSLADAR